MPTTFIVMGSTEPDDDVVPTLGSFIAPSGRFSMPAMSIGSAQAPAGRTRADAALTRSRAACSEGFAESARARSDSREFAACPRACDARNVIATNERSASSTSRHNPARRVGLKRSIVHFLKESTRQRGKQRKRANPSDTSDLVGSELQLPGCVVDYARGGGSSGGIVTERGITLASAMTGSGTEARLSRAVLADASAAGAQTIA